MKSKTYLELVDNGWIPLPLRMMPRGVGERFWIKLDPATAQLQVQVRDEREVTCTKIIELNADEVIRLALKAEMTGTATQDTTNLFVAFGETHPLPVVEDIIHDKTTDLVGQVTEELVLSDIAENILYDLKLTAASNTVKLDVLTVLSRELKLLLGHRFTLRQIASVFIVHTNLNMPSEISIAQLGSITARIRQSLGYSVYDSIKLVANKCKYLIADTITNQRG